MKKNLFKYIFVGVTALSMTACSDQLETSPSASVSGDQLLGSATMPTG